MARSALDYIAGYVNCYEFFRKEAPKTIEVTEELYTALENEIVCNSRFYSESDPRPKYLLYRTTKITKGFSGWSARGLSE